MTLVLKESPDCNYLFGSNSLDNNIYYQPKTYEYQLHDPKGKSRGYRRWFHLRPGITLLVDDYTLQEDLIVKTSSSQPSAFLELSFSLLGNNNNESVQSGQNALMLYQDSGQESWIRSVLGWKLSCVLKKRSVR
jgi:AraC family transcriptional regulator, transcriptional activator of the genes for pyochelin and ferripyochelin receptors